MYKPEYGSQICPKKANVPYLPELINRKEVNLNEHCEMANNCTGLYDVYARLHTFSVVQCWHSSLSMPINTATQLIN